PYDTIHIDTHPQLSSPRINTASPAPTHLLLFHHSHPHPHLPSFPTRRSSDLSPAESPSLATPPAKLPLWRIFSRSSAVIAKKFSDRKSTRLNSSHVSISYAVFCLKKKKMK